MPQATPLSRELDYIALLFALFVVPKMLQRYRIPAAVTSIALGAVAGMGLGRFTQDPTVGLLATLGITSLFLFAGLDVDFAELRRGAGILLQHLALGLVALGAVAAAVRWAFELSWRPAVLLALALLTPSTGFILDSLPSLPVSPQERSWIKSKAVATELVALVVLFVILQSATWQRLAGSVLALGGMILLLPLAFRLFASLVVPHAPKSEFAFLLMVAVVSAFATRRLGVYYLVGAFVVGVAAQRFRQHLPALASDQMLHAVEVFASFFVPFYFFHAGAELKPEDFSWRAGLTGALLLAVALPLRVGVVALHRHLVLKESFRQAARLGTALLPTLVFGLVIAAILRDSFGLPRWIFGGLMIYALATTLAPALWLRLPAPELDVWHTSQADHSSLSTPTVDVHKSPT